MPSSHHAVHQMASDHRRELYALGNPRGHYRSPRRPHEYAHGDPLPEAIRELAGLGSLDALTRALQAPAAYASTRVPR